MRERTITIKVTDDDLKQANFDISKLSELDFHKVVNSIEIGLKISVAQQAIKANGDHWWLPRITDTEDLA